MSLAAGTGDAFSVGFFLLDGAGLSCLSITFTFLLLFT